MDAVSSYIDIFTKLIIAFIGLVAPLTSYLLTNFSERIASIKKMSAELKRVIEKEHVNEISKPDADVSTLSKKSTKSLLEVEKQEAEDLKFIEPKNNIIAIFIGLFSSLIVLIVDIFFRKDYFHDIYAY